MTTRRQVNPRTQRQAEQYVQMANTDFSGMTKDAPTTELSNKLCYRNVNVVDKGQWFEGRPGSRLYGSGTSGINYDTYPMYGRDYSKRMNKIITHAGQRVYVNDNDFSDNEQVVNISGVDPVAAPSTIIQYEDDALLLAGDVFRIVKDTGITYMHRMTVPRPVAAATAWSVSKTETTRHSYRYTYSFSRLVGDTLADTVYDGDRKTIPMKMESGTLFWSLNSTSDVDYVEEWSEHYIGQTPKQVTISGTPRDYYGTASDRGAKTDSYGIESPLMYNYYKYKDITHYSLYRTKDVGFDSGNSPALYVWVADVPIVKSISFTATGGYITSTGGVALSVCDVRNTIWFPDGSFYHIVHYLPHNGTFLLKDISGNIIPDGTYNGAIGTNSVATMTQSGTTVTKVSGVDFASSDVGKTIFWVDGSMAIITGYTSTTQVTVDRTVTRASATAGAWIQNSGIPVRYYFDTVRDNGIASGEDGLDERLLSSATLYTPPYLFNALPSCDTGVLSNGMLLTAKRGEESLAYAAVGDKPHWAGIYRDDEQFENLHNDISHIVASYGTAAVFCRAKTYLVNLVENVMNVGVTEFGEYIPKLSTPQIIDDVIGVRQWRTVCMIKAGVWIAVTNEPAVRMFDGKRWSKENYAAAGNVPCIMNDLKSVGDNELMALYSDADGYIIFGQRYVPDDMVLPDEIIVIGTRLGTEWLDVGGQNNPVAIELLDTSSIGLEYEDVGGDTPPA